MTNQDLGDDARAREALRRLRDALAPVEGAIGEGDWKKAHALGTLADALMADLVTEIAQKAAADLSGSEWLN